MKLGLMCVGLFMVGLMSSVIMPESWSMGARWGGAFVFAMGVWLSVLGASWPR
jgi:hypothetical protein